MPEPDVAVGLCAKCVHGRRIRTKRGSEFWYCKASQVDSRFPKYPRLPVLHCSGYEVARNSADDELTP